MSGISTHVLDVSRGVGAAGVAVTLERAVGKGKWQEEGVATTDGEGRVKSLMVGAGGGPPAAGEYRIRFATGAYWQRLGVECFHPVVEVTFMVSDDGRHHHVPLLLSPFGYTTYRGT